MAIAPAPPSLLPLQLGHGLSLIPRLQIALSFARADLSVKPIDEWQLRESFKAFLKDSLSIVISDRDLSVHKERDLHKKKRDEPVASGVLYIWDLQGATGDAGKHAEATKDSLEDSFRKSKRSVVERLSGVELNMGGMKLKCQARPSDMDDFAAMRKCWEADFQQRNVGDWPDTLIITGVPSRWFAEPRVSSKASILVTHTIFSSFGAIRNLDVQEGDLGKLAQESGHDVSIALNCHALVQYETYNGFCNAMKGFCGHSLVREGSSYRANYELSWDRDGYFTEKNIRKRKFEKDEFEVHQRRQLALEARQAEIAFRQAELVRLEQEKREFKKMELLRELEERRKQEIEAARVKEKRRKEVEEQLLIEEELLRRKEKEQLENELRKRQLRQQERQEREKKKRHTKEARHSEMEEKRSFKAERSEHRLQVEEDLRRLEDVHRRFEEIHSKTKAQKLKEESLISPEPNEIRGSNRLDQEDYLSQHTEVERWVLEDAQSEESAYVSELLHGGISFYEPVDDVGEFVPISKRLRSIIVDSR